MVEYESPKAKFLKLDDVITASGDEPPVEFCECDEVLLTYSSDPFGEDDCMHGSVSSSLTSATVAG